MSKEFGRINPAAPLGVLTSAGWLKLPLKTFNPNHRSLAKKVRLFSQSALIFAVLSTAVSSAQAWEPYKNPFASSQQANLGWGVANLHAGSFHTDGIGLSLGVVPIRYLEVKGSFAYRYERSFAAYAKVNVLPMAFLCPYLTAGYVRAGMKFDKGLSVTADNLFAGLGLQSRFLDRYFLGIEAAGLYILQHSATVDGQTVALGTADRFDVYMGFQTGVYFP